MNIGCPLHRSVVTRAKDDLRRLAQHAERSAARKSGGTPPQKYLDMIAKTRDDIARAQAAMENCERCQATIVSAVS